MDRLEQELRKALQREEPSTEFRARVLARVSQESQRESRWRRWTVVPRLRFTVAVALCAMVLGGLVYQQVEERRRAEGEAAREQVMVALRIASTKMKLAQTKVQRLSAR